MNHLRTFSKLIVSPWASYRARKLDLPYPGHRHFRQGGLFNKIAFLEDGVIQQVNLEFTMLFKASVSEMIGCPIQDFIAPDDHRLILRILCTGIERPYETIGVRLDGKIFGIELVAESERDEISGSKQIIGIRELPPRSPGQDTYHRNNALRNRRSAPKSQLQFASPSYSSMGSIAH